MKSCNLKNKEKCIGGKYKEHTQGAYNEAVIFLDNDQRLYNQKWAFIKNYCRKIKKGTFDRNKAKIGFRHFLDKSVNPEYKKQMGSAIPLGERRVAENILVKDFQATVKDEGGCDNVLRRTP